MRDWLSRAVRAPKDAVWTADGYVSEKWLPVSPLSGRIDAFEWKVPVEQLGAPQAVALDADGLEDLISEPPVASVGEPADVTDATDDDSSPDAAPSGEEAAETSQEKAAAEDTTVEEAEPPAEPAGEVIGLLRKPRKRMLPKTTRRRQKMMAIPGAGMPRMAPMSRQPSLRRKMFPAARKQKRPVLKRQTAKLIRTKMPWSFPLTGGRTIPGFLRTIRHPSARNGSGCSRIAAAVCSLGAGLSKLAVLWLKPLADSASASAAVAQLVEHVIRNDGVVGSSPISGTSFPIQIRPDTPAVIR